MTLAIICLYAGHLFSVALIGNDQSLELTLRRSEDETDAGFLAEKTCVDTGLAFVSLSFEDCHEGQSGYLICKSNSALDVQKAVGVVVIDSVNGMKGLDPLRINLSQTLFIVLVALYDIVSGS